MVHPSKDNRAWAINAAAAAPPPPKPKRKNGKRKAVVDQLKDGKL